MKQSVYSILYSLYVLTAALVLCMSTSMIPAHAAGVLDWLEESASSMTASKSPQAEDGAMLLTLEPGETEMYPKTSPDGRSLLTVVNKGKQSWVSRRYAENGDPANIVTDDAHAFDALGWRDNGHVYFLSGRAGGLGLWEKISDGEGMLRRLVEMRGQFTQPVLLPDGAMIAVRLSSTVPTGKRLAKRSKRDGFNNWDIPGHRSEIVRIDKQGTRMLSEGINPALSPDGQWLAFAMPVGRSAHLFRMRTDGSELIQVTDARSADVQPAWSADGQWIVFTSNRGHPDMRHKKRGNWDIWAISPEGRNLTQLTTDPGREGGASVGADGRVYFHSDRKVDSDLAKERGLRRAHKGFHIWSVALPSTVMHR